MLATVVSIIRKVTLSSRTCLKMFTNRLIPTS